MLAELELFWDRIHILEEMLPKFSEIIWIIKCNSL